MFDKDLQKEFSFCNYLLKLLPPDEKEKMDLNGMLCLEYYKLENTFKGAIELKKEPGVLKPAEAKDRGAVDPKAFLEEIIQQINSRYSGSFTDGDKVVLATIYTKVINDPSAMNLARTSDPKVFKEAQFKKIFEEAAMEGFDDTNESYRSLFDNKQKFQAMQDVLANIILREATKTAAMQVMDAVKEYNK